MRCIHCNAENPLNSIFCDFCGVKLQTTNAVGQLTNEIPDVAGVCLPKGKVLQERYVICDIIKQGGMSTIYLASDLRFTNRKCIIKEMQDSFDNQEERDFAIVSFHNEADMLASLNHPAIPKVYDRFTELNKRHYLVLEYIGGSDLEDYLKLKGGVLSVAEILDIVLQVCDVLQYLHSQPIPIVYRDLKPENLLREDGGRVKLIDFGIARFFDNRKKDVGYGTPGYAAPEQYDGIPEPRTDLFALGAVMHYFCTGRNPQKEKPFAFPSVSKLNNQIPENLVVLIESCLALVPARRPASADEVAKYLERIKLNLDATEGLPQKIDLVSTQVSNSLQSQEQQAFIFRNGDKAFNIMEWIALCDRRWEEGQEYFTDGKLEAWLQAVGNTVVLEKLRHHKKDNVSPAIALEKFIKAVGLVESPQLAVNIYTLNFNNVTLGVKSSAQLRVINKARGYLYGEVKSSHPEWLIVKKKAFEGNDLEVNITVDTSRIAGGISQGSITITSNGGEAVIPVTVQVLEPRLVIKPEKIFFQQAVSGIIPPQKFRLENSGAGDIYGSIQSNVHWLHINKTTFRGETECEVSVNENVLPPHLLSSQTLNGQILISSNSGENSLPVTMEIKALPKKQSSMKNGLIALAMLAGIFSIYAIAFEPFHYWHRLIWTFSLKSKVTEALTVENQTAYFGTDGYRIYAVDAGNGTKRWMYITSAPVSTSLCFNRGFLYFGTEDGRLHALNLKSGMEKWRFRTGGIISSTPVISGKNIYFGSQDNKFYALDLETGKQKWSFAAQWGIASSPSVNNGMVYFGSEDNKLYALSLGDGRLVWDFETGGVISSSPLVYEGNVYFGSEDGKLYALDALTGKKKWEFASDGLIASSPTTDGKRIYFGSYDRSVYALDIQNGQKEWEFETGGWVKSSLVIQNGIAYFGSYDKKFYAISTKDGKMKWEYLTEGWISFSPLIHNGIIYFSAYDKKVYALHI